MKYLLYLLICFYLLICISFVYTQTLNISFTKEFLNEIYTYNRISEAALSDIDIDRKFEISNSSFILKTAKNELWVKNVEISSKSSDVYSFKSKLKKNNVPVTMQVPAAYGYILVFTPNSYDIEVYQASENGSKNSDVLYITMK